MSGTTINNLNDLNGISIQSFQVGFETTVAQTNAAGVPTRGGADTTITVGAGDNFSLSTDPGNMPNGSPFNDGFGGVPIPPGSPVRLIVSDVGGHIDAAFEHSSFNLFAGSDASFTLVGWNAHAILLESDLALPGAQFVVISDENTPLTGGLPLETSLLTFGTSGPAPMIDGVQLTVCFAAGTAIATPSGTVAVEDLAEGDLVQTLSGIEQPIGWIGRRTIDCTRHPQPGRVMPVQVQADAFGPGLPVRPLTLSPEHALFLDGALVPVHCLINGTTIRQVPVDSVTYFHVELPRHDVVFAEGLPAESYLDTGNRQSLIRRDSSLARAA